MADFTNKDPQSGNARREPAIRTMKSDIEEFMKETKPSLIEILTKQAEYPQRMEERRVRKREWRQVAMGAASFLVLAAAGFFLYRFIFSRPQLSAPSIEETAPESPVLVEKTKVVVIARNALTFFQNITATAETTERAGTIKRLTVAFREINGETSILAAKDFFEFLSVTPPRELSESLAGGLFINFYYETERPHMALIVPVKNVDRAFAGMIKWEDSIQRDLDAIFIGKPPPPIIAPFTDKTYQNIDYRFVSQDGRGIGYFVFPPKNLLVISTSEDALKLIISRLLAAPR